MWDVHIAWFYIDSCDEPIRVRGYHLSSECSYGPQAFDNEAIEFDAWHWLHDHRERGGVEFNRSGRRRLHVEQHAMDATQTILDVAICAHNLSCTRRVKQVSYSYSKSGY